MSESTGGGGSGKMEQVNSGLDRLAKKQKVSMSKTMSQVDSLLNDLTKCNTVLNMVTEPEMVAVAIQQLHEKVTAANVESTILNEQKELQAAVAKYGKLVEKCIPLVDLSHVNDGIDSMEPALLNTAIAQHFYREGLFNVAVSFVQEAGLKVDSLLTEPFVQMHKILGDLVNHKNLETAITWAQSNSNALQSKRIDLEFELYKLKFLEFVATQQVEQAIEYARSCFPRFASRPHTMKEIQKLMCSLVFIDRIEESPYSSLIENINPLWEEISHQFVAAYCSLLGLSRDSPLMVCSTAGSIALPKKQKIQSLLLSKSLKLQTVEIDLGREFNYHPIFACPVSREQTTPENPPMLLVCGHVLSRLSMLKLAKSNSRFKCPYCPTEQSTTKAVQIHF